MTDQLPHDRENPQYQLNLTKREKVYLQNLLDDQVHNLGILHDILKDLQNNNLIILD